MKKIILTGGGSAGHVTPNIAIIPELKKAGFEIYYIGSKAGIERELIEKEQIPYFPISTGKLRRYFNFKNFSDLFRVAEGFRQAVGVVRKIKPDIVFSKGGFVSCPVVWAAWLLKVPVVIHESDMTPGLTNKLSIPFAKKVCFTFPESRKHLPIEKGVLTGLPIRESLLLGDRNKGKDICGFHSEKPVIMVIGGSLGSENMNQMVRKNLTSLLEDYQICHICGKGNVKRELAEVKGYRQFEYVREEQPHLYAMADFVISRAGATVLFEILALKKPHILIPLSKNASRGDQILNANSFKNQGFSQVIQEEELKDEVFMQILHETFQNRDKYIEKMKASQRENASQILMKILYQNTKGAKQ